MIVWLLMNMIIMIPLGFAKPYYPGDHPKLPTPKKTTINMFGVIEILKQI